MFGYEIPLVNPINFRYNQRSMYFDLVFPKKFGKKKVFITIIPKEILKGVNKKEYKDNYELLIDIYDFICSMK